MAVDTLDLNQISLVLSQLVQNYNELAQNWFDIFYNPEAMDIPIKFFDADGNLQTYTLPNRAKDFTYILNGTGNPENSLVAKVGSIYQDILNGDLYLKRTGDGAVGWQRMMSLNEIYSSGNGSPEGVVPGKKGDLYVDLDTGLLYTKTTATGTTGWSLAGSSGKADQAYVDTKFNEINDNIDNIEQDIVEIREDIAGLNGDIDSINDTIDSLNQSISTGVVHISGSPETITSAKTFTNTTNFNGAVNLKNSTTISGASTFSNTANFKKTATFSSTTTFSGANTFSGTTTFSGNTNFSKVINGTAYRALSADIAEYYNADEELAPGTLIMFGGKNEISIAQNKVNGVVSTNPAYILNDKKNMEYPTLIVLTGRTPVRVIGPVQKFDSIVISDIDGVAKVDNTQNSCYTIIGRALETNLDEKEKLVECVVKISL